MSCRYIPEWAWLSCLAYFDGACAYCGTTRARLTADHLVPKSKGGSDDPSNIVPACEACNEAKGDQEWHDFMINREDFSQNRLNKVFNWRRICAQARVKTVDKVNGC